MGHTSGREGITIVLLLRVPYWLHLLGPKIRVGGSKGKGKGKVRVWVYVYV